MLQNLFLPLAEAIDARRNDRLHGIGDHQGFNLLQQLEGAGAAAEVARSHQAMDRLLDEERVATGALADALAERIHPRGVSEQLTTELLQLRAAQRRQCDLAVDA